MRIRLWLMAFIVMGMGVGNRVVSADEVKAPQPDPRGPGVYVERLRAVVADLKLTDEQRQKVEGYFTAANKALGELDDKLEPAERSEKAHAIINALRVNVGDVLTNEQKLQVQKKMQPPGPGAMIDRIKQQLEKPELKLTEEQRKQIDAVLDETRKALEDLRASNPSGAGADVREKIRDIMQSTRTKLSAILTAEQQQQLKEKAPPPAK